MTKVRLKEVNKELNQKTGVLLAESERVRRNAEIILQMLRQQESQFLRQEEEERQRQRYEQQQRILEQQAKAWTMPDDDVLVAEPPETVPAVAAPESAAPRPEALAAELAFAAPKGESLPVQPLAAQTPSLAADTQAPEAASGQAEPSTAAKAEAAKPEPSFRGEQPQLPPSQPVPTKSSFQGQERPQTGPAPAYPRSPSPSQQPFNRPATPAGQYANQFVPGSQQAMRPPLQGGTQYPRPPLQGAPQYARPPLQGSAPQYGRPAPYGAPRPLTGAGQPLSRPPQPFGPRTAQPFGARPPQPYGARPPFGRPGPGTFRPGEPRTGPGFPGLRPKPFARPHTDEAAPPIEKERVSNYDPNKKNYVRQHDPERVVKNKKQLSKNVFAGEEDEVIRGGKKARAKKLSAQQMMAPIKIEKAYMTAESITVKDLTERIGRPAGEILKKLLLLGNMANINSELDYDTASLVCGEFGCELEIRLNKTAEDALSEENYEDTEEDLTARPPVITIMGHVDHGKTSLLDYIRKSHVTATEAGGITQHIGAYTVDVSGQTITFLDTPGHEAFTAMRARGAQATDIAVLVVAADDGVMPQTVEAINHAKAAGVPIVVVINKMDKPGADPERIKQDLTAYSLVPEEWGGETIMVPVSSLTGEGIDRLLEMILLQSDVLQLRANPGRKARGVIIEAKLDKSRGPLATVLLRNGTLRVGDNIVAGTASGRVRAMQDDKGERVMEAGPSMPVEVSGFDTVPFAGDQMIVVGDDRLSKLVADERRDKEKELRSVSASKVTLDNLFDNISEGKIETLNLIVKADVQGSVEAVRQALDKLSNDKIKTRTLHSGVGAISKDDVNLASAFGAIIIGFNIRPDAGAREVAEKEGVDIRLYRIIYQAIEDIEKAMNGMLQPEYRETVAGHAEVRNVFRITGAGTVAGCYVTDGKLYRNYMVRLLRDNVVIHEGKISSLRRFKDDVKEVAEGYECGVGLENFNDIKEKDVLECFVMEAVAGKGEARA